MERIAHLEDKIIEAESTVSKATSSFNDIKVTTSQDNSYERKLINLISLKEQLNKKLIDLNALVIQFTIYSNELSNTDYAKLLELRYIKGMTWNEVRSELLVSESVIFRLHKRALGELEELIENREKE